MDECLLSGKAAVRLDIIFCLKLTRSSINLFAVNIESAIEMAIAAPKAGINPQV